MRFRQFKDYGTDAQVNVMNFKHTVYIIHLAFIHTDTTGGCDAAAD